MTDLARTETIIAIESAISGGSLSLWSKGSEIDCWIGEGGVSRAEDLLPNIAELLTRNAIPREMVGGIAVSIGPGSFTGIRIGIATALGLKDALRIPVTGVSVLEAIAFDGSSGCALAAVPMGRDAICYQAFDLTATGPVTIFGPVASRSVPDEIIDLNCQRAIVHGSIIQFVQDEIPAIQVKSTGLNLAGHIARAAMVPAIRKSLEPLFLSLAAG